MKRNSGRCMALALALVMILSLFPVGALAEGDVSLPVRFICDETTANVTVYDAGGQPVAVGADGVHHLTPGTYYYSAEAEGYESTGVQPFTVPADAVGDQELRLSLTPVTGGEQPAAAPEQNPQNEAEPSPTPQIEDDGKLRIYPADGSFHLTIDGEYTTAAAVPAELQEAVGGKDRAAAKPGAENADTPAPGLYLKQPAAEELYLDRLAVEKAIGYFTTDWTVVNLVDEEGERKAMTGSYDVIVSGPAMDKYASARPVFALLTLHWDEEGDIVDRDVSIIEPNVTPSGSSWSFRTDSLSTLVIAVPTGMPVVDEKPVCTVSFVVDGEVVETRTVQENSPIGELPAAPEKEGYTFIGWMKEEASETEEAAATEETVVTEATLVTADLRLTALYKESVNRVETTLTDEASGIEVSGLLPEEAVLQVVPIPLNTAAEIYSAQTGEEAKEEEILYAFDISIFSGGEKVDLEAFGDSVTVTMPNAISEEQAEKDNEIDVLHVKVDVTDGAGALDRDKLDTLLSAGAEKENLEAGKAGNLVFFDLNSFSTVIVRELKATPDYPTSHINLYFDRDTDHPEATYVQTQTAYLRAGSQASFGKPRAEGNIFVPGTGYSKTECDVKSVSYASADPSIVSIDPVTGVMTGMATGVTKITITIQVHDHNEDVDRNYEFKFDANVTEGGYATLASQGNASKYPDVHTAVAEAAATDTVTIHGTLVPLMGPDVAGPNMPSNNLTISASDAGGVKAYYLYMYNENPISYDSCVIDGKDITVISDPSEGGKLDTYWFSSSEAEVTCGTTFSVINDGTLRLGSADGSLEFDCGGGGVFVRDGKLFMDNVTLNGEDYWESTPVIIQQGGWASIKNSSINNVVAGSAISNAGTIETLEDTEITGNQTLYVLESTGTINTIKNLYCYNSDLTKAVFRNDGTIGTIDGLTVYDDTFCGDALLNDEHGVIGELKGKINFMGRLHNRGEIKIFEGSDCYIEAHTLQDIVYAIFNEGKFDSEGGQDITGGTYITPKYQKDPGPVIYSSGSIISIEPAQTNPTGVAEFGFASEILADKITDGNAKIVIPDGYHMSRASAFDCRYIAKDVLVTYVYQDGKSADFKDTENMVEAVPAQFIDDPIMMENVEYYTVVSETPVRDGYTFLCWNTAADGSGQDYEAGDQFLLADNVMLYAKWQPISCTITYDPNGGTLNGSTAPSTETHDYDEEIKISPAPTREGYTFLYWKGSEYQPGDSYTVKGDHTFVAQWEENAEPKPTPTATPMPSSAPSTNPAAPKTGDPAQLLPWLALLLISSCVIVTDTLIRRKRRAGRGSQRKG